MGCTGSKAQSPTRAVEGDPSKTILVSNAGKNRSFDEAKQPALEIVETTKADSNELTPATTSDVRTSDMGDASATPQTESRLMVVNDDSANGGRNAPESRLMIANGDSANSVRDAPSPAFAGQDLRLQVHGSAASSSQYISGDAISIPTNRVNGDDTRRYDPMLMMNHQLNPAWSVDPSANASGSSGVQQVAMKFERTPSGHQIGMKYQRTFSGRETWVYVSDKAPPSNLPELNSIPQESSPPAGTLLALGDYDFEESI